MEHKEEAGKSEDMAVIGAASLLFMVGDVEVHDVQAEPIERIESREPIRRPLVNRAAVLTLLCCHLACSNQGQPAQQSSDTTPSAAHAAAAEATAATEAVRAPGICPGLPTLSTSDFASDSVSSARQVFLVAPQRFGNTEASLSRCLGEPLMVQIDTVTNIHTEKPDNILHLTYPGLRFSIYRVLADGKEILFQVEAFGPADELAFGIRVGVPWTHVLEQLGTPTDEDRSSSGVLVAHYLVDDFAEETVTFRVENGIVSAIVWDYYID